MSVGIGVVLVIAPFAIYFLLGARGSATPTAATAAAPATSAPATSGSTPVPRISAARWLNGLQLLQTRMNGTATRSSEIVTRSFLRSTARRLRGCSTELARLGPPVASLEPVYRLAAQACGKFRQAARCYATAARDFETSSATGPFPDHLRCGDADSYSGSDRIGLAVEIGTDHSTG